MLSLGDFITKYTGVGVDFDKVSGFQCVQLVNQYLNDVLGITNPIQVLPGATAFQIWENFNSPLFTKILNTETNAPESGDIVFWQETASLQITSAGHVDIASDSITTATFNGFDQDYPFGSLPHIQNHDYVGVLGWLHPIQQATESATSPSLVTEGLNTYGLDATNLASVQAVFDTWHSVEQGLYTPVATYNAEKQTVEDLQKQVSDLQSNHVEDTKEILNLNSSLSTLSTSNKDYATQTLDAEKKADTYVNYMGDIAKEAEIVNNNLTEQQIHDEIIKTIISLKANQKTAEGEATPQDAQNVWQNGLQSIVNWLLKHGFSEFLAENNLHVIDANGNLVDDAVSERVIAYLDNRFSRLDLLERAQQASKNLKAQLQQGRSLFKSFIELFYKGS